MPKKTAPPRTAGDIVRNLVRDRYGNSQTDAAEAFGVSQGFISEVLSGKRNPGMKLIRGIRRAVPDLGQDMLAILWDASGDDETEGAGPPRRQDSAPVQVVTRDERYEQARDATTYLIAHGHDPDDVRSFLGGVLLDESKGPMTALGYVRLYEHRVAVRRRMAVGDGPVGEDEF